MATGDLERVFAALERERVRYLVVGGVAVVLHGHLRFTADLDLVVQLEAGNAKRAIDALLSLGFKARDPVDSIDFADPLARRSWIDEQGIPVFTLSSAAMPGTDVDLFVEEPFDFADVDSRAMVADLGTTTVRVISRLDLIAMKRKVGRQKDIDDALMLESLAHAAD